MNKNFKGNKIINEGINITLNINTDTICFIITKAREFQAKEGVTFPEEIPDSENEYDWAQVLADHEDDMTFREVKAVIEDLEPDQKIDLLMLMYIGRGDFEAHEWQKARKFSKERISPLLTEYLFSKPQISNYLEKALEYFGFSCDTNNNY